MKIYYSVGDPSGDQHAALSIRALKQRFPEVVCAGLGGPTMEAEGFSSFFSFEKFNRMGYTEVLKEYPFFVRSKNEFVRRLATDRPDLLVCVDYSGFNRPMMKAAHKLGIPVLWFIAPMIWAWKKQKHGPFLGRYASHIATILPFEKEHWLPFTSKVSYVGSPLLEKVSVAPARVAPTPDTATLALIPGSRYSEVTSLLPDMLHVAEKLQQSYPHLRVVVSHAPSLSEELFAQVPVTMEILQGDFKELLLSADIALVTSGTATLEAAFVGLPHAIVYKTSWFNYTLMRWFLRRLSWIGLPNIVAEKSLVPEYIQHYKIDDMASYLRTLLTDPAQYQLKVDELSALREKFEEPQSCSVNLVHRICDILGEPYVA